MFIEDWKKKFPRLWSVRLALLSALLSAVEFAFQTAIPILEGLVSPGTFALLSMFAALAAAVARIVQQKAIHEAGKPQE
jgi:hypothetical protein